MGVKWMVLSFAAGAFLGAAYGFWRGWCAYSDVRDLNDRLRYGGRRE
jgi:hypothetical protein